MTVPEIVPEVAKGFYGWGAYEELNGPDGPAGFFLQRPLFKKKLDEIMKAYCEQDDDFTEVEFRNLLLSLGIQDIMVSYSSGSRMMYFICGKDGFWEGPLENKSRLQQVNESLWHVLKHYIKLFGRDALNLCDMCKCETCKKKHAEKQEEDPDRVDFPSGLLTFLDKMAKYAYSSSLAGALTGHERVEKNNEEVASMFDTEATSHLFAFGNGVYNLKTHEFMQCPIDPALHVRTRSEVMYHAPGEIVETRDGVPYDANMIYVWDKLREVHLEEDDFRCRLEVYADSLIWRPGKRLLFVEYGPGGGNGKSTMQKMLLHLMGKGNYKSGRGGYYTSLENSLLEKKDGKPRSDALMAALFGRIAVFADFTGTINNFDLVKKMTGSDPVQCDSKYLNDVTREYGGALIMYTNHELIFSQDIDTDQDNVKDCVRVMRFDKTYKNSSDFDANNLRHMLKDDDVQKSLEANTEYIVALFHILVGRLKVMQGRDTYGIVWSPGVVKETKRQLCGDRQELQDKVDEFLQTHCTLLPPGTQKKEFVKATDLAFAFNKWKGSGTVQQVMFKNALRNSSVFGEGKICVVVTSKQDHCNLMINSEEKQGRAKRPRPACLVSISGSSSESS